jgi:adenosylhomocysteinase
MDMSFAIQALSAEYIANNRNSLTGKSKVIPVPEEIDVEVAKRKLLFWGLGIDELTPEQKAYINSYNV